MQQQFWITPLSLLREHSAGDELTAEYGKAIVFDYSCRYFHGDGFGKDFTTSQSTCLCRAILRRGALSVTATTYSMLLRCLRRRGRRHSG